MSGKDYYASQYDQLSIARAITRRHERICRICGKVFECWKEVKEHKGEIHSY